MGVKLGIKAAQPIQLKKTETAPAELKAAGTQSAQLKRKGAQRVRARTGTTIGNLATSYNDLTDKPTLDGKTIVGDMAETDPTVPNWAKAETRPVYTAEEVGAMAEGAVEEIGTAELSTLWEEL